MWIHPSEHDLCTSLTAEHVFDTSTREKALGSIPLFARLLRRCVAGFLLSGLSQFA
ncbi:hypothetical protein [Actinomyces sp. HMSC065F11]|uniref:hypothetical protein n=1 Tax=Actinomyces sp. HMSC065F11 TaxID=1739395 RepID=UPI00164AB7FF|nr:hypothetical protein [Actinomyces sp. HMSC065F11]